MRAEQTENTNLGSQRYLDARVRHRTDMPEMVYNGIAPNLPPLTNDSSHADQEQRHSQHIAVIYEHPTTAYIFLNNFWVEFKKPVAYGIALALATGATLHPDQIGAIAEADGAKPGNGYTHIKNLEHGKGFAGVIERGRQNGKYAVQLNADVYFIKGNTVLTRDEYLAEPESPQPDNATLRTFRQIKAQVDELVHKPAQAVARPRSASGQRSPRRRNEPASETNTVSVAQPEEEPDQPVSIRGTSLRERLKERAAAKNNQLPQTVPTDHHASDENNNIYDRPERKNPIADDESAGILTLEEAAAACMILDRTVFGPRSPYQTELYTAITRTAALGDLPAKDQAVIKALTACKMADLILGQIKDPLYNPKATRRIFREALARVNRSSLAEYILNIVTNPDPRTRGQFFTQEDRDRMLRTVAALQGSGKELTLIRSFSKPTQIAFYGKSKKK